MGGGGEADKPTGFLSYLGPGLVTGAADDDPSGIVTFSQAGAAFRYGLLWTVLLQVPLMSAAQMMCARIGGASGGDLGDVPRDDYPPWVLWSACALLLVANTVARAHQHGDIEQRERGPRIEHPERIREQGRNLRMWSI